MSEHWEWRVSFIDLRVGGWPIKHEYETEEQARLEAHRMFAHNVESVKIERRRVGEWEGVDAPVGADDQEGADMSLSTVRALSRQLDLADATIRELFGSYCSLIATTGREDAMNWDGPHMVRQPVAGFVDFDFENIRVQTDEKRHSAAAAREVETGARAGRLKSVAITSALCPRVAPEPTNAVAVRKAAVPP